MRLILFLTLFVGLAGAWPSQVQAQWGFDRPGGDYASAVVRSGDPAVCAARCERDVRCRAWSFAYPAANRAAACFLKSQVTTRVESQCCVTGVKGAALIEPRVNGSEYAIDRVGGDYRSMEIAADATGSTCKAACQGESRCRAWTYVRPGYIGPSARCYLKDRVTRPRQRPCCISGVIR